MNELHEEDPEQYPRTARDGYMIDPREQMILERSLKKEGKEIKVIYHSHPDVGAYFSEKDTFFLRAIFSDPLHLWMPKMDS